MSITKKLFHRIVILQVFLLCMKKNQIYPLNRDQSQYVNLRDTAVQKVVCIIYFYN